VASQEGLSSMDLVITVCIKNLSWLCEVGFTLLAYFAYYEEIKTGLCYRLAVCVCIPPNNFGYLNQSL
jgi:hypothetical protein